jgi:hypothetical protein
MGGKALSVSNLTFGTVNEAGVIPWFYESYFPAKLPIDKYVIGRFQLPKSSTYLVVESLLFDVLIPDPLLPIPGSVVSANPYALVAYASWYMQASNATPYNSSSSLGVFPLGVPEQPGTRILNQDIIGPFPTRTVVVQPGSLVEFVGNIFTAIPANFAEYFSVKAAGRLISAARMKTIEAATQAGRD